MAKSRILFRAGLRKRDPSKMSYAFQKDLEKESDERRKLMSPAEHLKLPPLLEKRRQEFGITDGAFAMQPLRDQVYIAQLFRGDDEFFEGTGIVMTEETRRREKEQTPQGIIVGAGLQALDYLRMNGADLGHIVGFKRMTPWRIETDQICGKYDEILVMRAADVGGSVDLAEMIRSGEITVIFDEENYEHQYVDKDGNTWRPQMNPAFIPDDMG